MHHRLLRTSIVLGLVLQVSALFGQLSTHDHLADPSFWPTQEARSRTEFAGPHACAGCHLTKFTSARLTPMGSGAMSAVSSAILLSHPHLTFDAKQYHYAIDTDMSASRYTVTDGHHARSYNLTWAFGTARVGQSYLFKNGEQFYEARVTYFDRLKSLGFTPDRDLTSPKGRSGSGSRHSAIRGAIRVGTCDLAYWQAP
jgi:hypothetical protein